MDLPAKSGCSERLFTPKVLAILLGVLAVHSITLRLMGRIAWCKCGFGLWTSHAWSSDTSQMFADPYSGTHILHGIIFYAILHVCTPKSSVRSRFLAALL